MSRVKLRNPLVMFAIPSYWLYDIKTNKPADHTVTLACTTGLLPLLPNWGCFPQVGLCRITIGRVVDISECVHVHLCVCTYHHLCVPRGKYNTDQDNSYKHEWRRSVGEIGRKMEKILAARVLVGLQRRIWSTFLSSYLSWMDPLKVD